MELKYWTKTIVKNRRKMEELYLKQKKVWYLVNENIQQVDLLDFGVFDDFKA